MSISKIKVTICGKDYNLSSEEPAEVVLARASRADAMVTHFMNVSRLNTQNAAVLTVLDALTDVDKQTAVVDNLRSQISEYLDVAAKARADVEDMAKKLDKYKAKHDEAVLRTAELERNAAAAKDVSKDAAKLQKELEELKADVANKERYAYEKGKLESAETARAAVETSRDTIEKNKAAIEEKELELDAIGAKLEEIKRENTDLAAKNNALNSKCAEYNTTVKELQTANKDLSAKNAKLALQITDLEKQVAELKRGAQTTLDLSTAADAAAAAKLNEKQLKARNTELRRTIDNIRKENQTLKRENEQYSIKFQEKDIELDEMKAKYQGFESALTELDELRVKYDELENTNLKQTATIAELWEKLEVTV
jgi:cell division protein ZapA